MTEPKLKPCPLCGGTAKMTFWSGGDYWYDSYSVYCTECGIETENYEVEEYAIKVWNKRVGESEQNDLSGV